MHPYNKNKM